MASNFTDQKPQSIYNITGALIFTAYVFSALFLTGYIIFNLFTRFRQLEQSPSSSIVSKAQSRLPTFAALSALSFSVLSYHMLTFLIASYQNWALTNGIRLQEHLLSNLSGLHLWQWLTGSTLFLDFARAISETSARYWWTIQALLLTMAWSVFMGFEGDVLAYV